MRSTNVPRSILFLVLVELAETFGDIPSIPLRRLTSDQWMDHADTLAHHTVTHVNMGDLATAANYAAASSAAVRAAEYPLANTPPIVWDLRALQLDIERIGHDAALSE